MMRRLAAAAAVLLFALVAATVVLGYHEQTVLRPLAAHYVGTGPAELGLPNVITGILISYRGLDTLGEVAVVFMVAAGVGSTWRSRDPIGRTVRNVLVAGR